jgi:hypothetical protein
MLLEFLITGCQVKNIRFAPTESDITTQQPSAPRMIAASETALPTFTNSFMSSEPTPLADQRTFVAWQTQVALATPVRTPVIPTNIGNFPQAYTQDGTIYFINADSSQEEVLSSNETAILSGNGLITSPTFVPGTKLLLFNTFLCGPQKGLYVYAECKIGLYSFNIDTRKIDVIVENISGNSMSFDDGNFEVSPNGKYLSVAGDGHIDLYIYASGYFKIAYPNAISYFITRGGEYFPKQYWLPDSTGLVIVRAADNESNEPATPPALYVVDRYIIGEKQAVQLSLDKSIIWDQQRDNWCLSPDRNWIVFAGNETGDRRDESSYYLGNLNNGHTQVFTASYFSPIQVCGWSPDSRYFAFTSDIAVIASVDGKIFPIGGHFEGWIDATHYYYTVMEPGRGLTTYIGEINNN